MEPLRLALRYRDFAAGIDSIEEHNKIFVEKGAVLWGWWKKEHESSKQDIVNALLAQGPFHVSLVNRAAKRQFKAFATRIVPSNAADRNYVPEYYRANRKSVQLWVRIECLISEVQYDQVIADKFGGETLTLENQPVNIAIPNVVEEHEKRINPAIVLLSDFHFDPEDHNFLIPPEAPQVSGPQISLAEAINRDAVRMKQLPGLMIASGDFTSKAKWEPSYRDKVADQIRSIATSFKLPMENVIICPGNHDVSRLGVKKNVAVKYATRFEHEDQFRIFKSELIGRSHKEPLSGCFIYPTDGFDFVVGVLNSANLAPTDFSEYGYVGSDPLDEVLNIMKGSTNPSVKILVLHHHLIPVTSVELPNKGGISLTIDASDILRKAQEAGVQIVLHGHQHVPRVIKIAQLIYSNGAYRGLEDDMYIISAGSVGSKELLSNLNTYTLIYFSLKKARVCFRTISNKGEETAPMMEADLMVSPK